MTYFTASPETIIKRFFLMMAVVIVSIFAGLPYMTLLALPILLSAMCGVSFNVK